MDARQWEVVNRPGKVEWRLTPTGYMAVERSNQADLAAPLLADGRDGVLISGGDAEGTADLHDPAEVSSRQRDRWALRTTTSPFDWPTVVSSSAVLPRLSTGNRASRALHEAIVASRPS